MFNIYGGAAEFKQWELDKFVTNSCMKEGDEVVFRNSHGETYVVKAFAQGSEILADVPNYLLRTADNILVDLEQGNDRHPECRTTFTVVAQDKPDGYECKYNVPERQSASSGGSGLPAGAKPNQYIVTDGDGNAKWEDKLAYTEPTMVELLAETTVTIETDEGEGRLEMPALTIGKKYTVKLNGVVYDLECFDDDGYRTIGAPYGDWSGYPFQICTYEDVTSLWVQKAGTYTVSVSCEGETIHPIEAKYLNGAVKSVKWIMPETEVECTSLKYDSNFGEYVYVELADYFPGYLGEQYIVNVNGKDYKAVGFNDGASGSTTVLNGEEFHIFLRDKVWEADGAPGVQITLWGEIVSGPGTYTVSIRQEIENRADRNIFGTVHVAVSKASNHIYRGVLDGTTFDAVYKALESGFVGYFRVKDESDYTAGSVYGPRDLIGNIVEYSMNYIRVKCNDFSFVVTAGNTIESDQFE